MKKCSNPLEKTPPQVEWQFFEIKVLQGVSEHTNSLFTTKIVWGFATNECLGTSICTCIILYVLYCIYCMYYIVYIVCIILYILYVLYCIYCMYCMYYIVYIVYIVCIVCIVLYILYVLYCIYCMYYSYIQGLTIIQWGGCVGYTTPKVL